MSADVKFPELYNTASELSDFYQARFLWLVRAEFLSLLLASVLALDFDDTAAYRLATGLVILFGLVAMLVRSLIKPEQQWYKARAAAESMKTTSWRYMMRSHPFQESTTTTSAQGLFLGYITQIFQNNRILAQAGRTSNGESLQITLEMEGVRALSFLKRRDYYIEKRVTDQQNWYTKKARSNKIAFTRWLVISVLLYSIVIVVAFTRVAMPWFHLVPIEPLLLLASFIVGWIQIKKHSELAASYNLTAREISLAKEAVREVQNDEQFSNFVNDAELAFSREHTQWTSRQETAG